MSMNHIILNLLLSLSGGALTYLILCVVASNLEHKAAKVRK